MKQSWESLAKQANLTLFPVYFSEKPICLQQLRKSIGKFIRHLKLQETTFDIMEFMYFNSGNNPTYLKFDEDVDEDIVDEESDPETGVTGSHATSYSFSRTRIGSPSINRRSFTDDEIDKFMRKLPFLKILDEWMTYGFYVSFNIVHIFPYFRCMQ